MATRKISDLTLLGVGQVSSSDTLLLLDNSDPTDQNKRSAVGSIFTAVPSGTYTAPGVRFEGKTSTGLFSSSQGQVGLSLGNSRLNLQKVGTTLNVEARDDADQNLDFKLSAQGTGKIRLGSVLAINDLNFIVPNSVDETKVAKFSSINLTAGLTNVYSFPSNEGLTNTTDELVTLKATQTLENKTIVSPTFTGTLSVVDILSSGSTTLGDDAADSLTVNAAATFAASTTFSNTLIISQGATVTGDLNLNDHLEMIDDKIIKMGTDDDLQIAYTNSTDASTITDTSTNGLTISSADIGLNSGATKFLKANATNTIVYHNDTARITTSATGISIGGAIDAVTSITGSGDITIATDKFTLASATGDAVFGGNITGGGNVTATTGTDFQLGSTASAKLGIGRAATTYNLEVEGSIYSTGSTIIAGNGSAGKFILQKGAAAIGTHFTNNIGTDEMILDANANLGIGKTPGQRLDVSGNANVDGNLVITTTDPSTNVGGQIAARQIVLTNPLTGQSATLDASSTGGVSRARVFFANM
ncbi:YadA domain-containing protein [Eurybiavirus PHM1]|uniref:YadA domain-containing protein n=1 Tax=Prochlorococcus phage P-HM1 TaxID=445700 RepID=E3SML0_9CAUD|nr:YadA domain-containing protein [Prochlorococcus phage P-HM1]ADO98653.1 YadA domain-containing protein [Prochlorococcus phage P-HM1]